MPLSSNPLTYKTKLGNIAMDDKVNGVSSGAVPLEDGATTTPPWWKRETIRYYDSGSPQKEIDEEVWGAKMSKAVINPTEILEDEEGCECRKN